MYLNHAIYLGLAGSERVLPDLSMCNRHSLIAGAQILKRGLMNTLFGK